jgi:coenzyme F420-reducing hydrogenase alpha subunit
LEATEMNQLARMDYEETIPLDRTLRLGGRGSMVVGSEKQGTVRIRWEIPEAYRFLENALVNAPWEQVAEIAGRMCGVCAPANILASLEATERAFGITVSPQTRQWRKLLADAGTIHSHMSNLCYLALPQLLAVGSAVLAIGTHPDAMAAALRLKKTGKDLVSLIAGALPGPIYAGVGGFPRLPEKEELRRFRDRLLDETGDFQRVVEVLYSVTPRILSFSRSRDFAVLGTDTGYPSAADSVLLSDGAVLSCEQYLNRPGGPLAPTTGGNGKHHPAHMVGPLARLNDLCGEIHPLARAAAARLRLAHPCSNPFMNCVAQVVETAHCLENAVAIIDELLSAGVAHRPIEVAPRAGKGIGAAESPRGILFHEYAYDKRGILRKARIVTPLEQNRSVINEDLRCLAAAALERGEPREAIEREAGALLCAYDPCVSCSTYLAEVELTRPSSVRAETTLVAAGSGREEV